MEKIATNLEQYYLNQGGHYSKYEEWNKNLSDYERQAIEFLIETKTQFKAVFSGHGKHFEDDKQSRDTYEITLSREGKKPFVFRFGQSIINSGTATASYVISPKCRSYTPYKPSDFSQERKAPSAYDVLACLTKYDPETFENFCANFGYETDSRKAEQTYFSVQKEWNEVRRIWTDKELETLQEIQ